MSMPFIDSKTTKISMSRLSGMSSVMGFTWLPS